MTVDRAFYLALYMSDVGIIGTLLGVMSRDDHETGYRCCWAGLDTFHLSLAWPNERVSRWEIREALADAQGIWYKLYGDRVVGRLIPSPQQSP